MSESGAQSANAIGDSRVIPGERERGLGSELVCGDVDATALGPGLRRDDNRKS